MIIAPAPLGNKIRQAARTFLSAMRKSEFDTVWNNLLPSDSIALLSTVMWPLLALKQDKVDEFLSLGLEDELALSFQLDTQGTRSGLFGALRDGFEEMRWHAFENKNSIVLVDDTSAIFMAKTPNITLLMPFTHDHNATYKVDLASLAVFSMEIRASIFYNLGMRALELDKQKPATLYFELGANIQRYYQRLRKLMWDNTLVRQHITDARRAELQGEENFAILAKDEFDRLVAGPSVASTPIDMGVFLRTTFKGYADITQVDVTDQDLKNLVSMNDGSLRKSIATILMGVDPIIAQREAEKPHTSVEIAYMELAIKVDNTIYHLCMPFKSGRESQSSFDVNVFHQIMRPFLILSNCVVVFIAAKPCTQSLHNYIKQIRNKFGYSVEVIEHKELARLLKINELL